MFNWLDWILVPAVMFFVWEGWLAGGIKVLSGMISFLGSLWLAVKYHSAAGRFVGEKFGISRIWVDVVGYLIVAVTAETIISIALHLLLQKLTGKRTQSQWNRAIGAAANGIKGLVLAAFALLVIIALPLKGNIRRDIRSSILGSRLVAAAQKYGGQVETSINEAAAEAVRFLTIKPQSTEIIPLNLPLETCRFNVSEEEEWKMLGLINREGKTLAQSPWVSTGKLPQLPGSTAGTCLKENISPIIRRKGQMPERDWKKGESYTHWPEKTWHMPRIWRRPTKD